MLSLIICSKKTTPDFCLLKNIHSTIGTEYEIVHIDNSEGKYGICGAYNEGVRRSKGDILCFMHEDIIYHNEGWGKTVEKILSNPQIGILGVAGSKIVLDQMDWRMYEVAHSPMYLIQGSSSIEPSPVYYIVHYGDFKRRPLDNGIMHVAVVDGVWMCMRKELFASICFDEISFKKFHLYDSDICMQVNAHGLDVVVTDRILLEHKSMGSFSDSFCEALLVFCTKWKKKMPIIKGENITKTEIIKAQEKGKLNLKKHVYLEKKRGEIKELLEAKKHNVPCREFTCEEIEIMGDSAYICRKGLIKDKNVNGKYVRKMIFDYCNKYYAKHKYKLIWKYIWYRFLKIKM